MASDRAPETLSRARTARPRDRAIALTSRHPGSRWPRSRVVTQHSARRRYGLRRAARSPAGHHHVRDGRARHDHGRRRCTHVRQRRAPPGLLVGTQLVLPALTFLLTPGRVPGLRPIRRLRLRRVRSQVKGADVDNDRTVTLGHEVLHCFGLRHEWATWGRRTTSGVLRRSPARERQLRDPLCE